MPLTTSSSSSNPVSKQPPALKRSAVDPRFFQFEGINVYTGNELIVKGALEAGCGLITGYPGSPVSDVFDTLSSLSPYLAERGIVAQIANNEALSASRLNGARQAGVRAIAVMKSVGFHVAADALAIGNLMEFRKPQSGGMIIVGDDPWNETTQINSDSRFLSKHLHMPIVEPSTFQEIKDWIKIALEISGQSDLMMTYLLTTNQADGGGTVETNVHPDLPISRKSPATLSSQNINISDSVMIPPHTSQREATLEQRHELALQLARDKGLIKFYGPRKNRWPVGFITSGLSFCYLKEVLEILGLWERTPVLKLGMTYPLDRTSLLEMAHRVEHLVVVEEKRGFLEPAVSELLSQFRQEGKITRIPSLWGKRFPDNEPGFPTTRGLNASIVLEVLGPAFLRWRKYFPTLRVDLIEKELQEIKDTRIASFDVPLRLPTFCPGCPHRDSSVVSRQMKKNFIQFDYMQKKNKEPMDVIFHGESGCHSMLQFAPNEGLMQNYSGMGLGGGTGAGMDPFVSNKQVVFLGDSTFFHSGIVAVSDSIKNNQDITYIILQNDTTAMTGHQPTPGNAWTITGDSSPEQEIENVLKGMFPSSLSVTRINPAERNKYQPILEATVSKPGVKVIIADKECAITYHRRMRRARKSTLREVGFIAREEKINITPEVCEYCLECTRQTACPGLTVEDTVYGRKIATDLSTCVDDGACARTKACPSFEKVIIERNQPPAPIERQSGKKKFPSVSPLNFQDKWSAYTAGVGGMGAGVVNAILVRAGQKEGYHVSFLDKKGLAIRNGGVYGHVVFSKGKPVSSMVIPYGKADLLIGLDLLEAARGLDPKINLRVAHPARTRAVMNSHKNETVLSLMGREDFDPDQLISRISEKLIPNQYLAYDFSRLSEERVGSKLYANVTILGAVFQKGWLPISEKNLFDALKESLPPAELDENLLAFEWGRRIAVAPEKDFSLFQNPSLSKLIDDKQRYLKESSWLFGKNRARAYKTIMDQLLRWTDLSAETKILIAHTVYDLIRYDGVDLARRYVVELWKVYRRDRKEFGFRATHTVANELFRTMAIKDEVWVAQLLVSPEKYERDRQRYNIDRRRGDRIAYRHLNRPRFTVWGREIEFDIETRDWMLRLMARMKFLRKWLPEWHRKEKEFRDWYLKVVEQMDYFETENHYEKMVEALSAPSIVRGYREIRYPQMIMAREKAEGLINELKLLRQRSQGKESSPAAVKNFQPKL